MAYATVAELRDEGLTIEQVPDDRLTRLLTLATAFVDRVTGRFFEPRDLVLTLDGRGGRAIQLNHPIISVNSVKIDVGPLSPGYVEVDESLFKVYNRHLSQGLLSPDDRENPKIEFYHGQDLMGISARTPISGITLTNLIFPKGQQNITIDGRFGYTDPDGSADGITPLMINHVTKLLVMRETAPLADCDSREDAQKRWRIKSEKTRDQSYTLQDLSSGIQGNITGDPEIDLILVQFMRPADYGAV